MLSMNVLLLIMYLFWMEVKVKIIDGLVVEEVEEVWGDGVVCLVMLFFVGEFSY